MTIHNINSTLIKACLISVLFVYCSCKKYLEAIPDPSKAEPSTLKDLQAILDNTGVMNSTYPATLVVVADEYALPVTLYNSRDIDVRNNHIWKSTATDLLGWQYAYQPMYYANVVLKQLSTINANAELTSYNAIKGSALFFRAFSAYHIAQLWCNAYTTDTNTDPGIPVRLAPDIEVKSERSTVAANYQQIIDDYKQAVELLPESNVSFSRPNKISAYGGLARLYLSMRDYKNAGYYADLFLQKKSTLIDFNALSKTASSPIDRTNVEDIFYSFMGTNGVPNSSTPIDTSLYNSYDTSDLRKIIYFTSISGGYRFKGSYVGGTTPYCGIATDEMYLIRAEANIRAGNKEQALEDITTLLTKRYKTGQYTTPTFTNNDDVLSYILKERKKELIYRGLRWADLRRLNLEGRNISLSRTIDGTTYTLPAMDKRWTLLIPLEVINQTGIAQNPR